MSTIVLDGSKVARQILVDIASQAATFEQAFGHRPCLATVLVGDDPASHTYVRMKAKRCRSVGIESQRHELGANASTDDVVSLVSRPSHEDHVDGILVQHPMPSQVEERRVFESISPDKDVDGVTTASFAARPSAGEGLPPARQGASSP